MLYTCRKQLPAELVNVDCFYFLRYGSDSVVVPSDITEADALLPSYFEYGRMTSNSLLMLEQVLMHIYMPLLSCNGQQAKLYTNENISGSQDALPDTNLPQDDLVDNLELKQIHQHAILRDEFLINMEKFTSHVNHTIQQLESEIRLDIPDIPLDDDIQAVTKDKDTLNKLEGTLDSWEKAISTIVENELKKVPRGSGPLAEIDFWRQRNSTLSALSEQLQLPYVRKVIEILTAANSHSLSSFEYNRSEMIKYYTEAKDNVRFLSTLERHFKNLTHGSGFSVVIDTIPSMMNALRMVWIISRHYNRDERMVPLMERIAWELAERVSRVINVKTILK